MLAYYIQTLNPFIWQWGHSNFGIRWYGTAYLTGFIIAYGLMKRFIQTGRMALPSEKLPDFVLFVAILGVLVGGRLGEAVLYRPHMFTTFSATFPWWGLLMVQNGGMAAHGGILGVMVAVWVFARRGGYRFLNLLDCAAMVAPIGLCFGRLANFVNGELYGHRWHGPLAVQFPTELIYQNQPLDARIRHFAAGLAAHHPDLARFMVQNPGPGMITYVSTRLQTQQHQLQAVLALHPRSEILRLAASGHYPLLDRLRRQLPGWLSELRLEVGVRHLWKALHPHFHGPLPLAARLQILNLARQGNTFVIDQLRQILPPRIPSQLIEALLEGLMLFLICWFVGHRWRQAGRASAAFAIGYPIMRIIGEQFRMGDQPQLILGHWISLGVIYSVPMLIAGLIFWIVVQSRYHDG